MDRGAIENLRQALAAARQAAQRIGLGVCDIEDLEQVIAPAEAELRSNLPNLQTLSSYLNSVARSLRFAPEIRPVVLELDAAMRNAGVPTHWEH